MRVFLVELDTAVRVRDWVVNQARTCDDATADGASSVSIDCAALSGVFTRTMDPGDLPVIGVEENGIAITEAASVGAVGVSVQPAFFFNRTTRVLTVCSTGNNNDPSQFVYVAKILETAAYGKGDTPNPLVKTRTTPGGQSDDLAYDPRVVSLPQIHQSIADDDFGGGSVASFGVLILNNDDGRYDTLLGTRAFTGREIRIYKGDSEAAYGAFTLYLRAVMDEASISEENLSIPLVSLGRRLNAPVLTTVFDSTTYPNIDPAIIGLPIPKIWGTVLSAKAFRIASGRWKLASHTIASIGQVVDKSNNLVTVLTTDLTNGEFTVDPLQDNNDRLYADCTGYTLTGGGLAGETMLDVLTKSGIDSTKIDSDSLQFVDDNRAIHVGFQAVGGTIGDVMTLISQSAFLEWRVDRNDLFGALVKKRDQSNLVLESNFDAPTTLWSGGNNATLTRVTTPKFRGLASLQIAKAAPDALAYASCAAVQFAAGSQYTVTLVATCTVGATAAFRLSLVDSTGAEVLSDLFTISGTQWTRVTYTFASVAGSTVLCDSITVFTNSSTLCGVAGGELRIYPEYNLGDAVTVVIDDVEVVVSVPLDDSQAQFVSAIPQGPVIWQVRVPYGYDGRLGQALFVTSLDPGPRRLYPTSESRAVDARGGPIGEPLISAANAVDANGVVTNAPDAITIASAILTYFGAARMMVQLRCWDLSTLIQVGSVVLLGTTRKPSLPGANPLYRVIEVTEQYPDNGSPTYEITAHGIYDPIYKIEQVAAS